MRINESDRNDAVGPARIMRCGWDKEVRVKRLSCHETRAVLNGRALLVKIKRDLGNQIRGLLKNLGPIIGKAKGKVFSRRVEELVAGHPLLQQAVRPLLAVRDKVSRLMAGAGQYLCTLGEFSEKVFESVSVHFFRGIDDRSYSVSADIIETGADRRRGQTK